MRRLSIPVLVALSLALAAGPVAADQVYHTERLVLESVDGAAGSGMVVNIHPNGPNRYAIEQYQLRHADPNTSYQITLHLYLEPDATDCKGEGSPFPTAVIQTNKAGNGTAQLVLTPDFVAALGLPVSFPINWTASQGGPIGEGGTETHRTACTIVTLD